MTDQMFTYTIDGPKFKLKLSVYEALTPDEWKRMAESLSALKQASVLAGDDDPFDAVDPEKVTGVTFDGHEFPVSAAFVRELKSIHAQMKAQGIDVKPSKLDVEDLTEEEPAVALLNAVLKELGIQPHQDPVIKAREIAAKLSEVEAKDDSEPSTNVFSEAVRDVTQNDPWYGARPGINAWHCSGPRTLDGIAIHSDEEAKVEVPAGSKRAASDYHPWDTLNRVTVSDLTWSHRCANQNCDAKLYIRKKPSA